MAEFGMWPDGTFSWPNEEEMSELCVCGHTLGQHAYGASETSGAYCDYSPTECACRDWINMFDHSEASRIAEQSAKITRQATADQRA